MDKLNINQWAEEDRPRERFMTKGAQALRTAELLAILIGSGTTKETAVELMQRILNDNGNSLKALGQRSLQELMEYNGIGEAKAVTILAACELGKRRQEEEVKRESITCANDIYSVLHTKMQDLSIEQAWIMLLNQNYKLINTVCISSGGISETAVDVRQIIRHAVLNNATVLALAHNHPSNNASPSTDDDRITQRIKKACEIMRIHFLDHVIVTDGKYYSYQEMGRL